MDYIFVVLGIVTVNLLLSGDNALIIALASRELPKEEQNRAMLLGSIGAIGMRVVLTMAAVVLLELAYLQLVAGGALLWIALGLVTEKRHNRTAIIKPCSSLGAAVKTILTADLIMSIDNVIAIAAVARGNMLLLGIGLAVSIPIIIWGSKLLLIIMQRWPFIINIGAAFLGWTGGEIAIADKAMLPFVENFVWMNWAVPMLFTLVVLALGVNLKKQARL